jgi:hypothetical protein
MLAALILNETQAQVLRDATAGDACALNPILIRGGDYAGACVLPARVAQDPAFADHYDAFAMLEAVDLDTDAAFPPLDD